MSQAISLVASGKSEAFFRPFFSRMRGVWPIVTNVGTRMRWTLFGAKDERANKRTAKSCGLDIPTLISSLRDDDLAGDGGKKARLTRESTKETVKTIRAGNAGETARPVVTEARVLFCFVHGAVGAGCSTRHSPRPLFSVGANEISKLGRDRRRENVAVRL